MRFVDSPFFVRDDINEAVRLRLEQARAGGHPSSMAEAAAARDGKRDLAEQFQTRARAAGAVHGLSMK